ncbi:HAMP domain-containing sensor histidine kinase [Nonomuraea jabiensis]|uniref:sensor histidine kinase n=1 Tax=Nonomuraea jabiensis TaxID=882448 RepID=UPI0034476C19
MPHVTPPITRHDPRPDITDPYVFQAARSTAPAECAECGSLPVDIQADSPDPALGMRRREQELERHRQFASDASHEMRTALAGLRAELEAARLYPDQTDLHDLIATALRGVDRLNAILTDLRVLGEMETGPAVEPHQVDLGELVRKEVSRRGDRLTVHLRLQPGVIVQAVPIRIARLLTNLLDNAQRHAERMVEVQVIRMGDSAEMTVSDDGEGIAEAERERIFQRFTRLGAARRLDHTGTGLGLAIARDIARAHMGTLHARKSATGGACFVLRLPLRQRPSLPQ